MSKNPQTTIMAHQGSILKAWVDFHQSNLSAFALKVAKLSVEAGDYEKRELTKRHNATSHLLRSMYSRAVIGDHYAGRWKDEIQKYVEVPLEEALEQGGAKTIKEVTNLEYEKKISEVQGEARTWQLAFRMLLEKAEVKVDKEVIKQITG